MVRQTDKQIDLSQRPGSHPPWGYMSLCLLLELHIHKNCRASWGPTRMDWSPYLSLALVIRACGRSWGRLSKAHTWPASASPWEGNQQARKAGLALLHQVAVPSPSCPPVLSRGSPGGPPPSETCHERTAGAQNSTGPKWHITKTSQYDYDSFLAHTHTHTNHKKESFGGKNSS